MITKKYLFLILLSSSLFQVVNAQQSLGFNGKWRIYSERIFYDKGGAGALATHEDVFKTLEINANGTYNFGNTSGKWHIDKIIDADWKSWAIKPYGPEFKIVLEGWGSENNKRATGPVEIYNNQVTFIWVIYHVSPPLVTRPGNINMKFGN